MSERSRDKNIAILVFAVMFLLWIWLSYANYSLSTDNAKSISIIQDYVMKLEKDWIKVYYVTEK